MKNNINKYLEEYDANIDREAYFEYIKKNKEYYNIEINKKRKNDCQINIFSC